MAKKDYEINTIVLRKKIEYDDAQQIVEDKKTSLFKTLLNRPKKEEVHIHSLKLYYEAVLLVAGKYTANYFRKAIHTIAVDSNVNEVILGDGVFPIRSKSSLEKAFVGKRGKNKIDLTLEEHVFVEEEDEVYFDHHGREIKFPFKINSKIMENYPKRLLKKNEPNVKLPEITDDAAIDKLKEKLKKPLEPEVRDLSDEFVLREITQIYIPVFEARVIGPKKKVGIIRIDAARNKIL